MAIPQPHRYQWFGGRRLLPRECSDKTQDPRPRPKTKTKRGPSRRGCQGRKGPWHRWSPKTKTKTKRGPGRAGVRGDRGPGNPVPLAPLATPAPCLRQHEIKMRDTKLSGENCSASGGLAKQQRTVSRDAIIDKPLLRAASPVHLIAGGIHLVLE